MAKKALVVGISGYSPPNDLPSCVRDADAFAGVLDSHYKFDQVRVLKDGEATRGGFDRGLEWLTQGAGQHDRLVVFFSGHGYRYEKAGVIEEALVLQDGKLFDNDELAKRLDELPRGVLTVILDCGFTGGLEALVLSPAGHVEVTKVKRWIPLDPERLKRESGTTDGPKTFRPFGYLAPAPADVLAIQFGARQAPEAWSARLASLVDERSKALLVSACLADEAACASTSQTNGLSAFTSCLVNAIRRLPPTRSTIEVLQETGQELWRLGCRQTPIVKEPVEPARLGLKAFLTFQPALFVYSPVAAAGGTDQFTRSVAEAIQNTLSTTKEGRPMHGTTTAPTMAPEDISTIVNTVTPIVASVLQSRLHQSYGFQGSFPQQLGFGFQGQSGGPQGQGIGPQAHELAGIVTPLVLSILQSRSGQGYGVPMMGGQGAWSGGSSPLFGGWGGGSPFSGGGGGASQLAGGGMHPFAQSHLGGGQGAYGGQPFLQSQLSGGQGSWGGISPYGQGGRPEELGQMLGMVIPLVVSLLQSQGQSGMSGPGFQQQGGLGLAQSAMGRGGLHPQEIAHIVSTVTPIVASLVQSQAYQAQTMPRAA